MPGEVNALFCFTETVSTDTPNTNKRKLITAPEDSKPRKEGRQIYAPPSGKFSANFRGGHSGKLYKFFFSVVFNFFYFLEQTIEEVEVVDSEEDSVLDILTKNHLAFNPFSRRLLYFATFTIIVQLVHVFLLSTYVHL